MNTSNALLRISFLSSSLFDMSPSDSYSEWSSSLWFSSLPRKQSSFSGKSQVKLSAFVGPTTSISGHKSAKRSRGGESVKPKWIVWTLLRNLYIEPKDEEIMGAFLSITNETLREAELPQPQRKINKKKTIESRDIRLLFLSRSTER